MIRGLFILAIFAFCGPFVGKSILSVMLALKMLQLAVSGLFCAMSAKALRCTLEACVLIQFRFDYLTKRRIVK